MEDIGDLVFYIMAAVFVLIGAINKKKKRATSPKPQPVDNAADENDISVKEVAEDARARTREIIVSDEDFSWDEETAGYEGDSDSDIGSDRTSDTKTGQERVAGKEIGDDYVPDSRKSEKPVYSDGEWVEPMAAMFSHEGVSSLKEEEKHIYDIDPGDAGDLTISMKKDSLEESNASSIASNFNLAEAIVFSEILKRKENF